MTRNSIIKFAIAVPAVAIGVAATASEDVADRMSKLPPLIDREVLFGDPQISGAQLSPDGEWISFRRPYRGVMNIHVKRFDEPFEAARPVTADTERPVGGAFWTEDSRYILYVQDKGGNEDYHIYAVDPRAEAEATSGVPASRNLTPIDGVRAVIYAVPEANPRRIVVGLNDRDAALHDAYRLDIDSGKRELVVQNDTNVASWITDLDGEVRLAYRQRADGDYEIRVVEDGGLGRVLYECGIDEQCDPQRFHKDGDRVYMVSNKGDDVDLSRLLLINVKDGEVELVESDPQGEVDFGAAWFSDATEELVATAYLGDRLRVYPKTRALRRELRRLRRMLPDGEVRYGSSSEDETKQIVAVVSDVNPGAVYHYDRKTRDLVKLYDSRPELPSEHLAPMRAIRYSARDGEEIPAYLVTPKGVEPKRLPTVIVPHGGPWGRDQWGYDAMAQFLANRGYAVLMPNFRSSTGYGKRFLNAGNGEWGTGVIQHDITDGVSYLIEQGIADPQQIAIMGGSFGGYATLAGVTFTPELYAAGVSIVGPSNIITLLNSIPPYWGPIKQMFLRRVGDPEDAADRKRLMAQSPFFHARDIKAPLLVIQGANDPRVKKAESDQIVVALRELDRQVEYLVAADEGHGFAGRENRLAMFAAIERFLVRHLAGRAQQEMSPPVAQKLAALQVPIDTVTMPAVHDDADLAKTAALPTLYPDRLRAETLAYRVVAKVGGQEIAFDSTVEIANETLDVGGEEQAVWRLSSRADTPMGVGKDITTLAAGNLEPLRRRIEQGPVVASLDYATDAVRGSIVISGGGETPVDVKLDAPVLGSLSGLSAMPLAPGYETLVRTFEVQEQRVRHWKVRVVGAETLEVPAGSFDVFKVAVTGLDGDDLSSTYWLNQAVPHRAVRTEINLPVMAGGGQIVSELVRVDSVQ